MIGIPIGLIYANVGEWWIHKNILHGLGMDRKSFWSFHWHEHHAKSRRNDMIDDQYTSSLWGWDPQTKELVALAALAAAHAPLFPVAPFFTGTVWYAAVRYYVVHKKAHLDHEWAKENLPWHYDHHMGRDQNANWGVTKPWFDILVGTRKKYAYGEGAPKDVPDTRSAVKQLLTAMREEWSRAKELKLARDARQSAAVEAHAA